MMTDNKVDYSLGERRARRALARYLEDRRTGFLVEVIGTQLCHPPPLIDSVITIWFDDHVVYDTR